MRIAYFTDTYVPQVNGLVTSVLASREELERTGHEVLIFAPAISGTRAETNVHFLAGIPYYPQPEYTFVLPWGRGFRLRQIGGMKIDVIHSHAMFGAGFIGGVVAWWHGIPLVLTYHTLFEHYLHYFPAPRRLGLAINRGLTRLMCSRCAVVIAPTPAIRDVLLGYGVTARIEVLPTGLTRNTFVRGGARKTDFGVDKDTLLFSSAGRLGREKNFDLLFRALTLLGDRIPSWRLVIAGDGPERKRLEKLAIELGIADRVTLLGYVSRTRVLDLLEASDLFTFASVSETQGMVVLEAMARGTPVVAADAMGPGQMMRGGRGGWLAKANDAEDLAAKILTAVSDESARAQKAAEAQLLAREYAADAIYSRLAGFYAAVVAAH